MSLNKIGLMNMLIQDIDDFADSLYGDAEELFKELSGTTKLIPIKGLVAEEEKDGVLINAGELREINADFFLTVGKLAYAVKILKELME